MRRIELPRERFAEIAEEDDLTVQEQWDIEHAGIASESTTAQTTVLQLEELKKLEAALPEAAMTVETAARSIIDDPHASASRKKDAQERLDQIRNARAITALALAYQKLGPAEYAPIDHYEVVRVMCFLRSWDVEGPDGQVIPIPPDRSLASVKAFASVVPNSAMKAIAAATQTVPLAPTDFDKSPEAMKDPLAPTGGSSGSESPAASRSGKGSTGRATGSRSTPGRKSSSRRTGS